jgi:hypothetical protein
MPRAVVNKAAAKHSIILVNISLKLPVLYKVLVSFLYVVISH